MPFSPLTFPAIHMGQMSLMFQRNEFWIFPSEEMGAFVSCEVGLSDFSPLAFSGFRKRLGTYDKAPFNPHSLVIHFPFFSP